MSRRTKEVTWPGWVNKDVPSEIVQDQATDYWWERHIRRNGHAPAETMMREYHERNRASPEAAFDQALEEWVDFDASEDWKWFLNHAPTETHALLQRPTIQNLTEDQLTTIVLNTHAAREHARQARKSDLGDVDEKSSREERCRLLARYWLQQEPASGRGVREVLGFVIWGEAIEPRIAARLWRAVQDPSWKIRRLGLSILGELIGYARPTEYPPRNSRASKTLFALGFDGITI
jgi:hypothetical protein